MQRRLNRYNQLPEQVAELREYQRQQQQARAGDQQGRDATAGTRQPDQPGATPRDMTARPGMPQPGTAQPGTAQPGTPTPGAGAGTLGAAGAGTAGTGTGTLGAAAQPRLPDSGLPDYAQRSRDIMAGKDIPDQPTGQLPGMDRPTGDQPQAQDPTREQPLQVHSLATGVNAKALADLLNEAEKLMREGKFYSALDQYEIADQVAPNDPMVNLGRAIAELGASYYARADGHLREAFTKNPALLTAQYDLRGFLGEERLNFLVNDLRAISNKEASEPRSVFLLAFIDYNTGNPRRAAAYLDLAERRAGKPDPLFQSMRKLWNLPASQDPGSGGANK
jgi:tetratricopeptide (TPR) repeat protein